ncbi:MAG TPA: S8 family peptidase, partial [Armatimonadota bacterium]|nr:S8 family peptidase [Armatimonadota bacterium]
MNINSGSRKISRSLVVISMLLCLIPVVCAAEHAPDSIIIKLKPGKKASEIGLLNSSVRATKRHAIKDIGYYSFKLPKGADLEKVIERYQKHPAVEYAGPNHTLRIAAVFPDDPVFYYGDEFWGVPQWGLYNDVGTPGADIHAVDAWEITTGSPDVLIAVIDTGIVPDHPDLADKIWTNPGEIPDNGIDDDNNGYVDDVNGWNFIDNDNFPLDDHYITHGTMVAGIAAAAGNNMEGIAGVAWGCPILPCKVIASNGYGLEDDAARAVVYAVDLGAKVINMSLSGDHTPALEAAIDYAWSKGCLCVCASGNENRSTPTYPASYTNALAVGASNEFDQRCTALDWGAGGSNYGSYLDVVAPGSYIVSCGYFLYDLGLAYEPYDTQSGTSAAAPFVSGVAALIWSIHPEWTNAMVKHHIEHTADDITDYGVGFDIHTGWGRVNAYRALSEPIATVQTVSE